MSIEFPDLPYAAEALEPHISARTFEFHHGKHHKAYVDKLNAAIAGTDYESQSLEEIIAAAHEASDNGVFNNAAQAWNHTFLWHSMSPDGGGEPTGPLADAINDRFGDLDAFKASFKAAAMGHGKTPLLTLDVWEHAYYLDYQNKRDAYVDVFLNDLVNWEFAAQNFAAS